MALLRYLLPIIFFNIIFVSSLLAKSPICSTDKDPKTWNECYGSTTSKDGNIEYIYEGQWKAGKLDGQGTSIIIVNDPVTSVRDCTVYYHGSWRNGFRHGQGTFEFRQIFESSEDIDTTIGVGRFDENHLVKGKIKELLPRENDEKEPFLSEVWEGEFRNFDFGINPQWCFRSSGAGMFGYGKKTTYFREPKIPKQGDTAWVWRVYLIDKRKQEEVGFFNSSNLQGSGTQNFFYKFRSGTIYDNGKIFATSDKSGVIRNKDGRAADHGQVIKITGIFPPKLTIEETDAKKPEMVGTGTIFYSDGARYSGEFDNFDPNNYGTMISRDGFTKSGYWSFLSYVGKINPHGPGKKKTSFGAPAIAYKEGCFDKAYLCSKRDLCEYAARAYHDGTVDWRSTDYAKRYIKEAKDKNISCNVSN